MKPLAGLARMCGSFALGLLLAVAGSTIAAQAHDDAPVQPQSVVIAPRTEARLGDEELVIAYLNSKVIAFLQRYVDGVPISGASIQLTIDFTPTDLKEVAPGVYSSDNWPLSAGSNDIDVALSVGDQKQATTLTLVIPSGEAKAAPVVASFVAVGSVPVSVLLIAAALVFFAVNGLLVRRRAASDPSGQAMPSH